MLLIDSACPIAWRQPLQPSSSTNLPSTSTFSPTPSSKHHRTQPSLSSFDSITHDASSSQPSSSTDRSLQWLQRRYYETLYLGEEHSPLEGLLHHLRRFEKQRKIDDSSDNSAEIAEKIRLLLKTRKVIRKRFALVTSLLEASDQIAGMTEYVEALSKNEEGEVDAIAMEIVQKAIESGPGLLVGNELKRGKAGIGKMTKIWLQAIECREIQIQVLLVLYLLRLSIRSPAATTAASSIRARQESHDAEAEEQPPQRAPLQPVSTKATDMTTPPAITKRKRKAEVARRWTGATKGMAAFPWTMNRQSSRESHSDQLVEEDCSSPEVLSKRFESLLDSLCLQMVTCNLKMDDKQDSTPPSAEKAQYRVTERLQAWQLFGSEGRKRHTGNEDKDVLQWLCCSIIEPHFSKTLPRQCGIVRGKCFIPGSGTTPARPTNTRKESDTKKVMKPSQSKERSTSLHLEVSKDKDRSRRSMSRGKSPSPMPFSILKEAEEKRTREATPSLLDKLDARTVTVRKSWSRSQTIGPIGVSQALPTKPPSRPSLVDKRSDPLPTTSSTKISRPAEVQKEARTLVMATPTKNQSSRSSSFSQSQAKPSFNIPPARSATMASWRRTESQPVLSGVIKKELESEDDEEDIAADEKVVDSLFYDEDDSEDEESHPFDKLRGVRPTSRQSFSTASDANTTRTNTINLKRSDYDNQEDDGDAIVVKKRRTLPSDFSFALDETSNTFNTSKNPFAVPNIA